MTPSLEHDRAAAAAATPLPPNSNLNLDAPNGKAASADEHDEIRASAEDCHRRTRADVDVDTARNNFAMRNIRVALACLGALYAYVYGAVCSTFGQLREIARNDKRKMIHAFRVALTLNITALYTIFVHNDEFVGRNAIWAIMTVVVIYEFTTGATYCKGLNRAMGTFLAGVLVLGISQLAEIGGVAGHTAVTCISIFCVGGVATFLRFVPRVKARYDYGMLIFILTFSLLMISTTSNVHPVEVALSRLYMIAVGCSVTLFTTTFVFPIWAGEELHELVCKNFLKLAESLQGSVDMYLDADQQIPQNDQIYKKYQSLFTSKSHEDSLANFATWEPPHGKFNIKYPWAQYIKVGTALRHCSYTAMALHGCLTSKSKAPIELRRCFETKIQAISKEINNVISEVANNALRMQQSKPANEVLARVEEAAVDLHNSVQKHATLFVNISLSGNNSDLTKSRPHRLPKVDADTLIPWSGPLMIPSSTDDHRFFEKQDRFVARSGPLTCTFNYNMDSFESANNFSLATFVFLLLETAARLKHIVEAVEALGLAAKFQAYSEPCSQHTIDIQKPFPW